MTHTMFVQAHLGAEFSGMARVLSKRHIGKILFCGARLLEENIQLVFREEHLANYRHIVSLPRGSLLKVSGNKIHTRSGTPSLEITSADIIHIVKENLPDKQNCLSRSLRYRRRTIDLMTNDTSFVFFRRQSEVLMIIRKFLYDLGYHEFITGTLQEVFEGGQSVSFDTYCKATGKNVTLSLTSELKLRRLLVSGFDRVFEIAQSFRNEGSDKLHSPEFTLLEMYARSSGHLEMMELLESMVSEIAGKIQDDSDVLFTPERYRAPFQRILFREVFENHFGDFSRFNIQYFSELMPEMFNVAMSHFTWTMKLIEKVILPTIRGPAFLVELPVGMSPFVKNSSDGVTTQRAFFVADGLFVADIYSDENNPDIIQKNLEQQSMAVGNVLNKDYVEILSLGLGESAGLGMGLNRLSMLFLGTLPRDIKETILYPIL
ncbi:MAG: amino acid--tRNA ligase-related protein [Patescibacteria group bacterium]